MKRRDALEIVAKTVGGFYVAQFIGCKDSTSPNKPEPIKTYDLELYYMRAADFLFQGSGWSVTVDLMIRGIYGSIYHGEMARIDDYHFRYTFFGIAANSYCLDAIDYRKSDGLDGGSNRVGEIFDIKVVQTGITTRLEDIEPNIFPSYPYPQSPQARMACFQLKAAGTIVSQAK